MASSAQLTSVRQYLTKFGIEEQVSNAVNMAIKQNSDDPFRIISDYLRTLAKNQEDDDEADEIIDEQEEMLLMAKRTANIRRRRGQVSAAALQIPTGWSPPVHEKSQAAKDFLKDVLATNRLMKSLTPSDREQLMLAFEPLSFKAGAVIIRQGDPGDRFYILEHGLADISVAGKGSVMKATKGVAFGELALLHGAPRAATVVAESDVGAWALDEMSFKMILMGKAQQDVSDYASFLKNVPILLHCMDKGELPEEKLNELAHCLREAEYAAGRTIIAEGDEGNHFFIIREGEVKCTQGPEAKVVSKPLTRGDFFGELALLSSDRRAATVTAVQPTTVLMVSRIEFTRLLGSLSDLIVSAASHQRR